MDRGARLDCLLVDDHAMFVEALALLVSIRHPEVALETAGHLAGDRKSTRLNSSH